MKLYELLPMKHIKASLDAQDRWQAIDELLNFLITANSIPKSLIEKARTSLLKREKTMSTGIGAGIAIPHGAVEGLEKVVAAFGRSDTSINFEAIDDQPVKIVFLFLVPQNQFQTHLKTLAAIARFLNISTVKTKLEMAATASEIYAVFQKEANIEI